jgi:hypothetical protein
MRIQILDKVAFGKDGQGQVAMIAVETEGKEAYLCIIQDFADGAPSNLILQGASCKAAPVFDDYKRICDGQGITIAPEHNETLTRLFQQPKTKDNLGEHGFLDKDFGSPEALLNAVLKDPTIQSVGFSPDATTIIAEPIRSLFYPPQLDVDDGRVASLVEERDSGHATADAHARRAKIFAQDHEDREIILLAYKKRFATDVSDLSIKKMPAGIEVTFNDKGSKNVILDEGDGLFTRVSSAKSHAKSAQFMVEMARARGWETLSIATKDEKFLEEIWLAARNAGYADAAIQGPKGLPIDVSIEARLKVVAENALDRSLRLSKLDLELDRALGAQAENAVMSGGQSTPHKREQDNAHSPSFVAY